MLRRGVQNTFRINALHLFAEWHTFLLTADELQIKILFAHRGGPRSLQPGLQVNTFQVGEKVVYPNHGIATIENISSRAFAGQLERFYLLKITYNRVKVMCQLFIEVYLIMWLVCGECER